MTDDDSLGLLRLPAGLLLRLTQAGIRTIPELRACPEERLLSLPYVGERSLGVLRRHQERYDAYQARKNAAKTRFTSPHRDPSDRKEAYANPARDQRIRTLHEQGKTPRQIGEEIGLSRQQVYIHLTRMGIQPNRGQHAAVQAAHAQGLTPREISARLDLPRSSVYFVLKTLGLTPHPLTPQARLRHTIWEQARQGRTPEEIADRLAISLQAVEEALYLPGDFQSAIASP